MRRRGMRRNEEFRLTEPVAKPLMLREGIRELTPLGIVVNPKNHQPCVVVTDGTYVGIRSLKADKFLFKHGVGYYDDNNYGRSAEAQEFTDLPRCHTPQGVTPLGQGYGTALYTALVLGAFQQNSGDAEIEMSKEGDGVCSEEENRSREADAWWNAASSRGLTTRDSIESTEKEENVDVDLDADDIDGFVESGKTVVYVNDGTVNVDLESSSELIVDSYKYEEAQEASLIVCALEDVSKAGGLVVPEEITRGTELKWMVDAALEEPGVFKQTNQVALLGIDVRGLDAQAVNFLALAYMASELGDKEVDALYYRWKHNLDPEHEFRQLQMFSPNARAAGLADVVEARKQANWAHLENLP